MERLLNRHWHHISIEQLANLVETDLQKGLSNIEVTRRQGLFGPNVVSAQKKMGPIKRFILQFHQPLVYVLLAAGFVTFFLKEWIDAVVILAVVVINAIIGFIQESKAEKAIESLREMVTTEATVFRAGKKTRIPSREIVPGDLVLLQSGDKVPADMRLSQVRELKIDESALTGESVSVQKEDDLFTPETILADRKNMAYNGTLVTYGQGQGIVVAIGDKTETGRISRLISEAVDLATPLTKKITKFSHVLLYVILALAFLTFAVGVFRGESAIEMFMASVALAVGAIPEGLPAAVTIMLAIGVRRMANRKAIIRKLPAVETLGSTTVICSDKTGTLTQNQMTVQHLFCDGQVFDVSGIGYQPEGEITKDDQPIRVDENDVLQDCLTAGLLCNESEISQNDGRWEIQGDPTEGALVVSAIKSGLNKDEIESTLPTCDIIPFESQRQYMATLHHNQDSGERVVYVKGAVEKLLSMCDSMMMDGNESELDSELIINKTNEFASRGMRVLALAKRFHPEDHNHFHKNELDGGLCFLGLQAMIDPPRPEVESAIQACKSAGIRVKMITGDHVLTASAIAKQLGLSATHGYDSETIPTVTGAELIQYSDEELVELAQKAVVFARVAPEQKLKLVEALQAKNHVVAMTGDGVNDAPALKQADIGIAMGITGTEVSKEAGDMLLTDDNFATIESAVEEGRGVFDNLTKFIAWTLPTNMGEGLVILAAIIAGITLPILPVQILWINITTALLLGLMLAFEPNEQGIMTRPPRESNSPILTRNLIARILLVSFLMLCGALGLFLWNRSVGVGLEEARTIAVSVFVFVELAYLFNCRSLTIPTLKMNFFSNKLAIVGSIAMFIVQLFYIYSPWMNHIFHSAPIRLGAWIQILVVSIVAFWIVILFEFLENRQITKEDLD